MPARKPTELKRLQGTLRKDRENPHAPKPTGELGTAPEHLTPEQQAAWRDLSEILPDGVAMSSDRIFIEVLSVLMTRFRNGEASNSEITNLLRGLGKLGLNPCDRAKIEIVPPEKPKTSKWGTHPTPFAKP